VIGAVEELRVPGLGDFSHRYLVIHLLFFFFFRCLEFRRLASLHARGAAGAHTLCFSYLHVPFIILTRVTSMCQPADT
jgi:hypothetical protein